MDDTVRARQRSTYPEFGQKHDASLDQDGGDMPSQRTEGISDLPSAENDSQLLREVAEEGAHHAEAERTSRTSHAERTQSENASQNRQVKTAPKRWTKNEVKQLNEMAGTCEVKVIAELLGRTRQAVKAKLKRLFGHARCRVVDGYSRRDICRILCCGYKRVNRLLEEGRLTWLGSKILFSSRKEFVERGAETLEIALTAEMASRLLRSRTPIDQIKFGAIVGVPLSTIRKWVNQGMLRIRSSRVNTESFEEYCRENYPALNWELMTREGKAEIDYAGDGWRASIAKIQGRLNACDRGATFLPENIEVLFSVGKDTSEGLFVRIAKIAGNNQGGKASRKIRAGEQPEPLEKKDIANFLEKEAKQFAEICARLPKRSLPDVPQYKHVMRIHQCSKCNRRIRGNAFFRHLKPCRGKLKAAGEQIALTRERIPLSGWRGHRPVKESSSVFRVVRAG